MSKLSPSLKALINAPFSRPGPLPAPAHAKELFQSIAQDASKKNLSPRSWLAISTATTFSLNAPDALPILHGVASAQQPKSDVRAAEFMREVGLKVHTSLVAISCLRAQTGVGPQVLSHVFGLRKTLDDGSFKADPEGESEDAVRWLATDEGGEWILKTIDSIVEAMGGSNFAAAREAKL
uniref:Uncharacterized protein n=1 Tax=Bionectria ochroleuca TaxID=29856 RepID=A0A0B7K0W7_BIOOC